MPLTQKEILKNREKGCEHKNRTHNPHHALGVYHCPDCDTLTRTILHETKFLGKEGGQGKGKMRKEKL